MYARSLGKPSHDRSGNAGFSLVELIIALMMMTIGVVATTGLVGVVAKTHRRATVRTEMTEIGQNKIEELRAYARGGTADTVQLLVGGSLMSSQADHADTVASGRNKRFIRRWLVDEGPSDTRAVILRVVPLNRALDDVRHVDFHTLVLII